MVSIKAMRIKQKFAKLLLPLFLAVVTISPLTFLRYVHAQNVTANVNLDWVNGTSSCYGTANGQTAAYYGAVAGDNVTLHVTNVSSTEVISIDITETGQSTYSTALLPGASVSPVFPANSEITLLANGSTCTSGHGGPGYFAVEAAAGSMSCSIANNQVWTVSINYGGIISTASLYRDGTYVDQFTPKNGQLNVPVQFAAMSTSATYNLYYGPNNSSRLLSQATCPAKTVVSSTGTSSTPKANTPPATVATNSAPAASNTEPTKPQAHPAITQPQSAVVKAKSTKASFKMPLWLWPLIPVIVASLTFGLRKIYPKSHIQSWLAKLHH